MAQDYSLFNKTVTLTGQLVTFAIVTKGEVVIESNGPATFTHPDGRVALEISEGRQQIKLADGTYTLAGNARVTIREISEPKPGVHFGSPDGQPVPGRKYVGA
jgi:hypothetical protein